jgi:hypothetical protein
MVVLTRLPRFQRQPDRIKNLRLSERDMEILRHVSSHRFLTSRHLIELLPGSRQQILRRLQMLFHHGFLCRPKAQQQDVASKNKPLVYGLANAGAKVIGQEINWNARNRESKNLFLKHTLLIADIMVGIEVACRQNGKTTLIPQSEILENARWVGGQNKAGWQVSFRHNGLNHRLGLFPDQIFGLKPEGKEVHWFFLEADRGTMPVRRKTLKQTSILKKSLGYKHSCEQKIPWNRFRIPNFRVLYVSSSGLRLKKIQKVSEGIKNLFLLSHADQFAEVDDLPALLNIHTN